MRNFNQEQKTAAEKKSAEEADKSKEGKKNRETKEPLDAGVNKWEMRTHKNDIKSVANRISKSDHSP